MMRAPLWTGEEIAAATGGTLHGIFHVTGVTFDSREVGEGDLFLAMRGEQADGHAYLAQAFENGAAGAIVERADMVPEGRPYVAVEDAMTALQALGKAARARAGDATIIGVTGSAGKTGIKEALYHALDRSTKGRVHRSLKSYNNHTGVPLSLSRMPRDTRFGIFEMGMNHKGELSDLTKLVRPHIAIVTTIAPAHQEFFASIEDIADAKAEIFEGLEKDGIAILPADSPYCSRLCDIARQYAGRCVLFGTDETADVRAIEWVRSDDGGSLVTAEAHDKSLCFSVSPPGDHWVANAMAVIAVVDAVGADLGCAGLALAELPGLAGRGARHTLNVDDGTALLIDESYNANPASMAATLAQLGREPANRRIAVLGAMKELGRDSDAFHAAIAEPFNAANIDIGVLIGEEMLSLAKALENSGRIAHLADAKGAKAWLDENIAAGDAILVKASNSVGLGSIVAELARGS